METPLRKADTRVASGMIKRTLFQQKYKLGDKFMARKQFCQSCSMPLDGTNNGTERDGSLSSKYCSLCYQDGEFRSPDMTLEQMKEITDNALKEKGWGKIRRWFAVGYISKLERWKNT